MRIGFAGTPQFAVTIYRRMLQGGIHVDKVLTQPPRRAGRGKRLTRSPVHDAAVRDGVEVLTPESLKGMEQTFQGFDVWIVSAYGLLLPRRVLAAPVHGCINVHASLLPRWRGASPIEHAILAGDRSTGVSIMQMEAGLDTGPVHLTRELALHGDETLESLTAVLAELGGEALLAVLHDLSNGQLPSPIPQDQTFATYAPRLETADAKIHWDRPAVELERRIRAFHGRGGAFATAGNLRLRLLRAQSSDYTVPVGELRHNHGEWYVGCGEGSLKLRMVQLNRGSGRPLELQAAANGFPDIFRDGFRFDCP